MSLTKQADDMGVLFEVEEAESDADSEDKDYYWSDASN